MLSVFCLPFFCSVNVLICGPFVITFAVLFVWCRILIFKNLPYLRRLRTLCRTVFVPPYQGFIEPLATLQTLCHNWFSHSPISSSFCARWSRFFICLPSCVALSTSCYTTSSVFSIILSIESASQFLCRGLFQFGKRIAL